MSRHLDNGQGQDRTYDERMPLHPTELAASERSPLTVQAAMLEALVAGDA